MTESYTYAGRDGRVSRRDTSVSSGLDVTQTFIWDELGNISSMEYPSCPSCEFSDASPTVTNSYTNGWLTSVPGYADYISYHPNGLVSSVAFANSVTWSQSNDPNSMMRPASISTTNALDPWSSGTYRYDSSGPP